MVVVAAGAGPVAGSGAAAGRAGDRDGSRFDRLRRRLLDRGPGPTTRADVRDRDRAAHLLLCFDQPARVLDLGLDHLVAELGTARGDAGLVGPDAADYHPTVVVAPGVSEAAEREVATTVAARPLPNQHPVLRAAWRSPDPVAFDRVRGNRHLGSLEPVFDELGTTAMLATRLAADGVAVGLLCIDEVDRTRRWRAADAERVARFVDRWLAPILVGSLAEATRPVATALSPAEREVVALLAAGRSYVEIARELGKSVRTVDNQLRSARSKAGCRNSVELTRWWLDVGGRPAPGPAAPTATS